MKKLKICLVSLGLFPDQRDGSAFVARGIYDELKRRGHDVTCLTAQWGEGFQDPNIIALKVVQSRFLWMPKFLFKFRKYLKTHQFDIIHGNGSRGSLPIIFSGKSYISHIHDLGPFETDFSKVPIIKWLELKNAKKASKIITVSEIIRQGIHDIMRAPLERIQCVYNAIDPRYKPMPEQARELKEKLGIKGPVLYYVGRLAFYKGIDNIIEAFYKARETIPHLNLLIAGKPELKMVDTVEKWKTEYPEVRFLGPIADEEMPIYYSMADAFVTYSFASEGFGLTPVEALACGTPVICSTMPAYQEVLADHAIFVEPKRPDLLAEKIIEFYKNPDLLKQLMKNADVFLQRYTWKAFGDQIEAIYSDFLENRV